MPAALPNEQHAASAAAAAAASRRKKSRSGYGGAASTCCRAHGSPDSHPGLMIPDVVEIQIPGLDPVVIPSRSIAVTEFWQTQPQPQPRRDPGATALGGPAPSPLSLRPGCVCDAHQRNTCLRDATCTKIHVCRDVWAAATRPIAAARQRSGSFSESVKVPEDPARRATPSVPPSMMGLLPTPLSASRRETDAPLDARPRPEGVPASWPPHGHHPHGFPMCQSPELGPSAPPVAPPAFRSPMFPAPSPSRPHQPYFTTSPHATAPSPSARPAPAATPGGLPHTPSRPTSDAALMRGEATFGSWDSYIIPPAAISPGFRAHPAAPPMGRDPWADSPVPHGWPSFPHPPSGLLPSPSQWRDPKPAAEPRLVPNPTWPQPPDFGSFANSPTAAPTGLSNLSLSGSPEGGASFGPSDAEGSDDSDNPTPRLDLGSSEAWQTKVQATRGKFRGLRGVGELAVHSCRNPGPGRGFGRGRGRSLAN